MLAMIINFLTGFLVGYSMCMSIRNWLLHIPPSPIKASEIRELYNRNKYIHQLRIAINLELDKLRSCGSIS